MIFEITYTEKIIGSEKVVECFHDSNLVSYGITIPVENDTLTIVNEAKVIMYNALPIEIQSNYTL